MDEYRSQINNETKRNEAGFIRLVVTVCLVVGGFVISLFLMQALRHRMASSSLMERLPLVLVLLIGCAVVFAYARVKRGRREQEDPDEEDEEKEDQEQTEQKDG